MNKILRAVESRKCIGCGNCQAVCVSNAIVFTTINGFQYPSIDPSKCVKCRKCEKVCPAYSDSGSLTCPLSFYAAYVKNDAMNSASTSGGICSFATKEVIQSGGLVFSARFTDDWDVEYAKVDRIEKHVGSKYMQANSNDVQKNIAAALRRGGKSILLIGTPCFVSAVKQFLDAEHIDCSNLITIDFICHGVPSPIVGKAFIQSLEKQKGIKLESYNFRSKYHGWGKHLYRSTKFEGEPEKTIRAEYCALHTWFGKHLSLRESCFQCDYRSEKHPSDITVADFWKVENYYSDIPTAQGLSAVQINTLKGKAFFETLVATGHMATKEVSQDSIWEHRNKNNFKRPEEYNKFWQEWKENGLEGIKKLAPPLTFLGLL